MEEQADRISTGISGLDEILQGGFLANRTYLIRGGPGTGKTTLGFHFLCAGASNDERTLFITLTEPENRLRQKGFDLNQVNFLDLTPAPGLAAEDSSYSVFEPGEVEQEPLLNKIITTINELKPKRVFLDCISQFQYLAHDTFQFRKQILSLTRLIVDQGATLLLSSEVSKLVPDDDIQFLCDGIINLNYNQNRRWLQVVKFRGSDFRYDIHSLRADKSGISVYPKLPFDGSVKEHNYEMISSGIPELDEMLHGGLERSTSTVISGPTGIGKTTLGVQFMKEAAGRGERSAIYTFEEGEGFLLRHCEAVNIPVRAMVERGTLSITKVNPLELSPDELSFKIRHEVEQMETKIVMIDSISGYRISFEDKEHEGFEMIRHLHALIEYLKGKGVTVLLINEIQNITGDFKISEHGISYLADNVIFLRYLEMRGEMRKALGVLKKRLSNFEKYLCEIEITNFGLKLGAPLNELRGILTGNPEFLVKD